MKRLLLPMLAIILLAPSCQNSEKKKAFDFNQKVAGFSSELNAKGREVGAELQTAKASHDFKKLKTMIDGLDGFINDKITELKGMDNVGGSENLKSSMLDFLTFEKTMVKEGFGPLGALNENSSEADVQAAIQNMTDKTVGENEWLDKVRTAQKEFAAKNGFKLATN